MKIDASKALGAYAAVATCAAFWFALGGAAPSPHRFTEIDVERINVREPDGTLRMVIGSGRRIPFGWVDGKAIPHPNRREAGIIFLNDEGTENGGLVFDGRMKDGRPTNGGSLTFDRWHQDQTIQFYSEEDGPDRTAGLRINDRPDGPMDFSRMQAVAAMPPGPARDAAIARANFGGVQRAYLGRGVDAASELVLRDGAGRKRLVLRVEKDGAASIRFLDEAGRPVRTERAAG